MGNVQSSNVDGRSALGGIYWIGTSHATINRSAFSSSVSRPSQNALSCTLDAHHGCRRTGRNVSEGHEQVATHGSRPRHRGRTRGRTCLVARNEPRCPPVARRRRHTRCPLRRFSRTLLAGGVPRRGGLVPLPGLQTWVSCSSHRPLPHLFAAQSPQRPWPPAPFPRTSPTSSPRPPL